MILVLEMKGQIQRVPKSDMAIDHRDANFEMSIVAHWTNASDDASNTRWARDVSTAAQHYVMPAVYMTT